MPKIILTVGLPASGKTTWAKEEQKKDPNLVRVNKDELRAMLHDGKWSPLNEKSVLRIRNFIVEDALQAGRNIIIDDTNLHTKHKNEMQRIAAANKRQVETKDFRDVSLEECLRRDKLRATPAGEKVIRGMYKQFLYQKPAPARVDPNLRWCIICDLDGTLALFDDKDPYDRDFENDNVNLPIKDILTQYRNSGVEVVILSGRSDKFKEVTLEWLKKNEIKFSSLTMRQEGDTRKDSIVKEEMYKVVVREIYNVLFVLDDRNQMVELWRNLGLTCLQVAEGDF